MTSLCEAANAEGHVGAWLCGLFLPNIEAMAELAGLDAIPTGLWPSWRDARVDAIVTMAGDAYMFGEAGLSEVDVPVMAIGGTGDTGTPYDWGTNPTFEYVSSMTKVRV